MSTRSLLLGFRRYARATMTSEVQRTRRRQAPEETRGQILESAQQLLRERSYRELSVDDLMARTGHTRTVFYRHFDDIPSLVLVLIQEVGGELVTVAQAWAQNEDIGPEVARARLAGFVEFYVRHGPVIHAVAEASYHDASVEVAYNGLIEGFVTLTTQTIDARMASGELEPIDAPEIARALVRMLGGYLLDALGREGKTDPARVLETVTTIWSRTLYPPR